MILPGMLLAHRLIHARRADTRTHLDDSTKSLNRWCSLLGYRHLSSSLQVSLGLSHAARHRQGRNDGVEGIQICLGSAAGVQLLKGLKGVCALP